MHGFLLPRPVLKSMNTPSVTRLLQRISAGESGAADELYAALYDELRQRASAVLGIRGSHTLQPTAIVHEAWLRIRGHEKDFASRAHFFGVAAKAMRSVLVDHVRARRTQKRGGSGRVPLDDAVEALETRVPDLVELDEVLRRLEAMDPQLAKIVEVRFFAGLTLAETATTLGISTATVERGWRAARAWLRVALEEER